MLVKEMAKKVDKDLLKKAFKSGLELEENNKYLDNLNNEQLLEELNKELKKLANTLIRDLDEDYDE